MSGQGGEVRELAHQIWPELSEEQLVGICRYFEILSKENEIQNLTRLIEPKDFVEGHLVDVRELEKSGFLGSNCMDLGSGGGVPGLLSAIIERKRHWVLTDSEGHKAAFLRRAADVLGLEIEVYAGRAEDWLRKGRVDAVVARAVGPVERIFGWIGRCSTWNTLVLLKGPGWEEEWKRFQESKHRGSLEVQGVYRYEVGAESKNRVIVRLARRKS